MAEKAVHGCASTTTVGLTQALGALVEITMRSVFVILRSTFIASCSTRQQPSRTDVEALIRHELSSPKSYLSSNRQTYYVGVVSRDLSAAEISALSDTGLDFQPGSAWTLSKGLKMAIVVPVLRPDGLYDV